VYAELSQQICKGTDFSKILGRHFSIKCGGCSRWFHGSCVGLERLHARYLEEKGLQLTCKFCLNDEEVNVESQSTMSSDPPDSSPSQHSTEGADDVEIARFLN
jgi:hypothetical protein